MLRGYSDEVQDRGFHNRSTVSRASEAKNSQSKGSKYHRYESTHTIVFKDYSETLRRSQGAVAKVNEGGRRQQL